MEHIDYLSKQYNHLIKGMASPKKAGAATLIALNGVSRKNLKAIEKDISQATKAKFLRSKELINSESQLSTLFIEAHNSKGVLFFDEADSLFGKRTEVRDSHDRYANLEVSHLLSKIEAHDGIVILASNLPVKLNSSLSEKVSVSIQFPKFLTFFRRFNRWF